MEDLMTMIRRMMAPSQPAGSAGTVQTRAALNTADIDPIDPATGQLTAGGVVAPAIAPAAVPAPQLMGNRPLNAQEALQAGDPKLKALLQNRQLAVPAPPAVPSITGFGAKPRQTSFGDGTGSP